MRAPAIVGLIACLASVPALADCVEPRNVPHMPDGARASREEMLSAMKALRVYDAAVTQFMKCVRKDGDGQADQANQALDSLTSIADRFNAELRAFKKKSGA